MGTAEIIIIALGAAAVILLIVNIVISLKKGGRTADSDFKEHTDRLKEQIESGNRAILDQMGRQNSAISDSIKQNVEMLGNNIRSEQKNMSENTAASLKTMSEDIAALKKENKEGIDKINSIVTEKMQETLNSRLEAMNSGITKNFNELGNSLSREQKNQLEIINQNMEKLRKENSESLDKINGTVNEKLQETLDKKINESFKTVSEQLMNVSKGLGEMQNVASDVSDLRKVLSNVKTRGNFGEVQLEAILADILTPDQYETQAAVKPNSPNRVDFAIKLPGVESGQYVRLPIDSKFPGDTYSAFADAIAGGNADEIRERRKRLADTIKEEAKSIRDKYIAPPDTTDFALMFLPSEGLYAEVVNMGLVDVLQREYHVNIAGPSTMAAMLSSLRMGFRTLQIQQKSAEIQQVLEAAKKEFANFGTVLDDTQKRLRKVDENLDKLIGTRTNAINRVLRNITASETLETAQEIIDAN